MTTSTPDITETHLPCTLHKTHEPANLTVEMHHVIPQAWQHFWVPAGETVSSSTLLWDPRTTPICPSGHRNVHHLLVEIMHGIEIAQAEDTAAILRILEAVEARHHHGHKAELETAKLAYQRWVERGGVLLALTASGEWGEA